MQLWDELKARGFIFGASAPETLATRLEKPLTLYIGFDVTAPSFHVGHLVPLTLLQHFQRRGHKVLVLLGTGTSQIGDPSDKKSERPMLTLETIQKNAAALKATLEKLLAGKVTIVDNATWLGNVRHLDFLRDVGRYFSVNRMMSFDFIKNRLTQNLPLSFLEMSYILLQSYDFSVLNKRHDCILQLGGQDQWANIISGVEFVRKAHGKEVFGLTCPLLTTSDGKKMGKTENGAVWLNPAMCSPYDFWQFWRNVTDADVLRFLKLFTFLPLEEIVALEKLEGQTLNQAKEKLADEVTLLVHGPKALEQAKKQTQALFGAEKEMSSVADISLLPDTFSIPELLTHLGFATSKSEARNLIRGKAVRLNNELLEDEQQALTKGGDTSLKLSVGKKKHAWLVVRRPLFS